MNKEWKKKYVTLCDNGLLTYHPSLHVSLGEGVGTRGHDRVRTPDGPMAFPLRVHTVVVWKGHKTLALPFP